MKLEDLLEDKMYDVTKLARFNFGSKLDKYEILAFGDVHYGHKCVDKTLLHSNLEYAYENEQVYLLLMGDLLEASTVTSIGGGIFEQTEFVQQQYEDFTDLLKPLAKEGRIIGAHPGNHELRIYKHSGLDITKMMCRELGVKYLSQASMHYWKVGKQKYSAFSFHGCSGARTVGGKLNAIRRVGQTYDVDMVIMGHVHDLLHTTEDMYTVVGNNPTRKRKHYIISGSYLGYWGSYAQSKGYNPGQLGSPKIKLHRDDKNIRVTL